MAIAAKSEIPRWLVWGLLAVAAVLFVLAQRFSGLKILPDAYVWQLGAWLNDALNYALREFTLFGVTLADISRDVAGVLAHPVTWLTEALTEGHYYQWADGSEFWLAPLPWFGIVAMLVVAAYGAGGLWPAMLAAITLAFVILLGLWLTTVVTLVAVLFSVLVSAAIGLGLGIWAHRSARASAVLSPIYDSLQTVPVFSYMSIIILMFGFGPVAALVATVIFAMPPMARSTELALKAVPPELGELAKITGCTPRQQLWLVDLPSQSKILLLGLNQVIMLSLAMVIITSVIGAGGLGGEVISSLRSMRMTEALLAGLAITLIAVVLDRTMRAWAVQTQTPKPGRGRLRWLLLGLLLVSITSALLFPEAGLLPDKAIVNVGRTLDRALDTFNIAAAPYMTALQNFVIGWGLRPIREFFAALPWTATAVFIAALGVKAGGRRLGLTLGLMLVAIALFGLWEKAMLSLYLVLASIVAAFILGLPFGILAGLNDRFDRFATVVVDLIQTLPTFVYLIPVVTLFGVGDFSAFVAIVIFVIAPIVRYTSAGLRGVPTHLSEAATMAGCTSLQKLRLVLMPAALPQLILGLNQAVMLGFSMLVITSLVGSRGLEEITLVAVSKVRPGEGLVAGFGIAALAIIVDRLLGSVGKRVEARFNPIETTSH